MTAPPKPRGSYAVMAQRREAPNALDDFPTPPWATRALLDMLQGAHFAQRFDLATAWEPAANRGYMVRPLREAFGVVYATDVFDYGLGFRVFDFLTDGGLFGGRPIEADWIITNPPFNVAARFAELALQRAGAGVALFCRSAFTESDDRFQRLFEPRPPTAILQFVERVPLVKGRVDPEASTATAYAWFVWLQGAPAAAWSQFHWIPPCRRRLELPGDYREGDNA